MADISALVTSNTASVVDKTALAVMMAGYGAVFWACFVPTLLRKLVGIVSLPGVVRSGWVEGLTLRLRFRQSLIPYRESSVLET